MFCLAWNGYYPNWFKQSCPSWCHKVLSVLPLLKVQTQCFSSLGFSPSFFSCDFVSCLRAAKSTHSEHKWKVKSHSRHTTYIFALIYKSIDTCVYISFIIANVKGQAKDSRVWNMFLNEPFWCIWRGSMQVCFLVAMRVPSKLQVYVNKNITQHRPPLDPWNTWVFVFIKVR